MAACPTMAVTFLGPMSSKYGLSTKFFPSWTCRNLDTSADTPRPRPAKNIHNVIYEKEDTVKKRENIKHSRFCAFILDLQCGVSLY